MKEQVEKSELDLLVSILGVGTKRKKVVNDKYDKIIVLKESKPTPFIM